MKPVNSHIDADVTYRVTLGVAILRVVLLVGFGVCGLLALSFALLLLLLVFYGFIFLLEVYKNKIY